MGWACKLINLHFFKFHPWLLVPAGEPGRDLYNCPGDRTPQIEASGGPWFTSPPPTRSGWPPWYSPARQTRRLISCFKAICRAICSAQNWPDLLSFPLVLNFSFRHLRCEKTVGWCGEFLTLSYRMTRFSKFDGGSLDNIDMHHLLPIKSSKKYQHLLITTSNTLFYSSIFFYYLKLNLNQVIFRTLGSV